MSCIGTWARKNSAQNRPPITTTKTARPDSGCVSTRSRRSVSSRVLPPPSGDCLTTDAVTDRAQTMSASVRRVRPGTFARRHDRTRRVSQPFERAPQVFDAEPARRHHRHDRDAEPAGQCVGVDDKAAPRGHVHHVQTDDQARVRRQQLTDEHQVAAEIGGVDDDDDESSFGRASLIALRTIRASGVSSISS